MKLTMPNIQSKITRHVKKKKSMNHNWEQNQATEIDPDDKTSRKNVRITIVNILHMYEMLEENMNMRKKEVENIKYEYGIVQIISPSQG